MKAKKILGWTIIIATILGIVIAQISAFTLVFEGDLGFLGALILAILIFLVEVEISILVVLAIKWITE